MNFGRARNLMNVDGDEVSLVRRPANKRKFLLMKGDDQLDPEIADILTVPAPNEGAILDLVRKDGADETVENAVTMAARLLYGVGADLTRETVEKLGSEMYSRSNSTLNTGHGQAGPPLNGKMAKGPNVQGSAFAGDWDNTDTRTDDDTGYDIDSDDANYDDDSPADLAAMGKEAAMATEDVEQADVNKRTFTDAERKRDASSGAAQSDGSYPIENKKDLSNAIQAFGRSKNKGKTKAHIIARAKALGATSMLPKGWTVSKSSDTNEGGDPVETHAVPLKKEDGTWDLSGVPAESRPFYEDMIQKADSAESELEATKERLAKADEATAALADALKTKELIQKAETEYGKVGATEDVAAVLKAASATMDTETYERLESVLKAANERIETGELFAELGRVGHGAPLKPSSAEAEAIEKANAIVEKGEEGMTLEIAMGRVWEQNPSLYDRYQTEKARQWATPEGLAAMMTGGVV